MLKFPDKIKIRVMDGLARRTIRIPDIIVMVHIFAMRKNDYHLGPFFTNENGELEINKEILEISTEAELQTGLMDYRKVDECSPLVEISILSEGEITNLIKGRTLWGIIGREKKLYNTKEELLNRIKKCNNNLVLPNSLRVIWNKDTPSELSYDVFTNQKP